MNFLSFSLCLQQIYIYTKYITKYSQLCKLNNINHRQKSFKHLSSYTFQCATYTTNPVTRRRIESSRIKQFLLWSVKWSIRLTYEPNRGESYQKTPRKTKALHFDVFNTSSDIVTVWCAVECSIHPSTKVLDAHRRRIEVRSIEKVEIFSIRFASIRLSV